MKVEMTGKEDRTGPWKIAICGHGGAGKTLFASTAPKPLYVFFSENPRIKSIARRYMPHVKLTNQYKDDVLMASVQDQLKGLAFWLQLEDHEYETLVIDTGDELFQGMKEARRAKNGGEFGISDWGWIADTYREVIEGLIDLHMNVIVNFHIKSAQEGESGHVYKELMLQGQAKDEAPGWFDVIGALDTYEVVTEDGGTLTKRVLLTHSSRAYPWVKDHSGALPHHFQISDDFVGDFDRMYALLTADEEDGVFRGREALAEIDPPTEIEIKSGAPVPSPEQLTQKKKEPTKPLIEEPGKIKDAIEEVKPKKAKPKAKPKTKAKPPKVEPEPDIVQDPPQEPEVEVVPEPEPIPSVDTEPEQGEPEVGEPSDLAAAEKAVVEIIGVEEDEEIKCDVCSTPITNENVLELGQMRYHKNLCRPDYLKLQNAK